MIDLITRIFNTKKHAKRMKVLGKIVRMSLRHNAFDMILTPETHRWLKHVLRKVCYISDNFILGSYTVHCVVACDRTAYLRHERGR